MDTSPLTLRVFLSSPGDVEEEREVAREVMKALEGGHLLKDKVRFEVVAWDDAHAAAPMDARATPQASVNRYTGCPADCDLTLVILWSRLGTPLPPGLTRADGTPYQSGTVWEYEDALAADKPVYIYRRTAKPRIDLDDLEFDDKRAQYEAVKRFFGAFTNRDRSLQSGLNSYADSAAFRGLLRQHLEAFVKERLGAMVQPATPVVMRDDPRVLEIVATLAEELQRKNRQIDEHAAKNAALRGRVKELEDQLQSAIARTLTAAAQPDASNAAVAAADALEAGDTRPAEDLLRAEERAEVAQIGSPEADDAMLRRQAAQIAREQGALAMGHDVRTALEAYQRAAEYEPDHTWTHLFIGDLHMRLGNLRAAMLSYQRSAAATDLHLQTDPDDFDAQRDLSVSYCKIGDVLKARGDGAEALAAYRKGFVIQEALAARDPASTEWQRDLSISHNRIGDLLVAQGDGARALEAYRKGLAIGEALAAGDPTNTTWQRDRLVSHYRIGDVLAMQADWLGARAAYECGLAITEVLAARDPASTELQRDLSVSYIKIADVLKAQGDAARALEAYRKVLEIREPLAERDPANTHRQRDLSVTHNKIGDMLAAQGNGPGALGAYQKGLAIRETLATRDPANTEWQRDLSVSHINVGDALALQRYGARALAAYRKALTIREILAARDPANMNWQFDLGISHERIGNMLLAQRDVAGALVAYRERHHIIAAIVARNSTNAEWQRDLSVSHTKIGDALVAQGDAAGALAAYREALAIREALAARDPANAQWQTDVAVSCAKPGTLAHGQSIEVRRGYLVRGREVLAKLKAKGRLLPNQDRIEWFDAQLAQLPPNQA